MQRNILTTLTPLLKPITVIVMAYSIALGLCEWDYTPSKCVNGRVFTTPVGGVTYYCSLEFELQVDLGTWA